jgi:hypothetical protein
LSVFIVVRSQVAAVAQRQNKQARDILFRLCPTSDYDLLFNDTTRAGAVREIQFAWTWRFAESYLATRQRAIHFNFLRIRAPSLALGVPESYPQALRYAIHLAALTTSD